MSGVGLGRFERKFIGQPYPVPPARLGIVERGQLSHIDAAISAIITATPPRTARIGKAMPFSFW